MRTKFNGNGKKNKGGRPSKYDPEKFPHMARVAAKSGMKDTQIAQLFQVTVDCITKWKQEYPEFLLALKEGKDQFDTRNVEASLLDRALGYEYDEVRSEEITLTRGKGKSKVNIPALKITTTRKKVQGDVTAIMFWLQNRQPDRWKNVKYVEGNIDLNHKDLDKLGRKDVEKLWNTFKREAPKDQSTTHAGTS